MEPIDPRKVEESIRLLPGIVGCKVVVGEDDRIEEVHILDASSKNPKQVIRDVESAVMVDCDLKLDHRVISIAQVKNRDLISKDQLRLKISGFSKDMSDESTEVNVELEFNDRRFTGTSSGIITIGNKLRYLSEATLRAVEEYLGGTCSLALNDIRLVEIGRDKAVLVSISIVNENKEEVLLGCSLVRGEEELSAIKATLDSINRRIAVMTG